MNVKLPFTWRDALRTGFSPDVVRAAATPFRKKRLSCIVSNANDNAAIAEIKQWVKDNKVIHYSMFGLFKITTKGDVFYNGISFEFVDDNHALMFKLSFA